MFQSPQWGSNSKEEAYSEMVSSDEFQSPQWGSNSKAVKDVLKAMPLGFSPRNGEVILKIMKIIEGLIMAGFSPRNGEVILKV